MISIERVEEILSYGGPRDPVTRELAESLLTLLSEKYVAENRPIAVNFTVLPIMLSMDEIASITESVTTVIDVSTVVEVIGELERVLKGRNASSTG